MSLRGPAVPRTGQCSAQQSSDGHSSRHMDISQYDCPAMKDLRKLTVNRPDMAQAIDTAMQYLARYRKHVGAKRYSAPFVEVEDFGWDQESVELTWLGTAHNGIDSAVHAAFANDGTSQTRDVLVTRPPIVNRFRRPADILAEAARNPAAQLIPGPVPV